MCGFQSATWTNIIISYNTSISNELPSSTQPFSMFKLFVITFSNMTGPSTTLTFSAIKVFSFTTRMQSVELFILFKKLSPSTYNRTSNYNKVLIWNKTQNSDFFNLTSNSYLYQTFHQTHTTHKPFNKFIPFAKCLKL